jgi:hypothetical protein
MKLSPVVAALILTLAAVGATIPVSVPANAETASYADPADARRSLTDIRAVDIDHGLRALVTRVRFTDLHRGAPGGSSGLTINVDTRPDRRGPEFRLVAGLDDGTDYQLLRVRDGKSTGEPLTCRHRVKLHPGRDLLTFTVRRSCLGLPDRARVGVRMRDERGGAGSVVDWLGEPRSYTDWVTSS